jgi:hypothetical protein
VQCADWCVRSRQARTIALAGLNENNKLLLSGVMPWRLVRSRHVVCLVWAPTVLCCAIYSAAPSSCNDSKTERRPQNIPPKIALLALKELSDDSLWCTSSRHIFVRISHPSFVESRPSMNAINSLRKWESANESDTQVFSNLKQSVLCIQERAG